MAKAKKSQTLLVLAVPEADVREVEPNGQVLTDVRIVGKTFDPSSQTFQVIAGGVCVPYSSHIIARLKDKALLPVDHQTASLAGVSYTPIKVGS